MINSFAVQISVLYSVCITRRELTKFGSKEQFFTLLAQASLNLYYKSLQDIPVLTS